MRAWRPWKDPGKMISTKRMEMRVYRTNNRYTLFIDGRVAGQIRKDDDHWLAFDTQIVGVGRFCSVTQAGDALARRLHE